MYPNSTLRYLVRNVYRNGNTENGLTDSVCEQQTESSKSVDERVLYYITIIIQEQAYYNYP